MVVHADERVAQGAFRMEDVVASYRDASHPRRFAEGKHLDLWLPASYKWLEWGTKRAPGMFSRATFEQLHQAAEKILVQRSPGPDPKCCYDDQQIHFTESSVGFVPWHALAGVRNNSLKKAARYRGEKPPRSDLPRREELEAISRRFSVKYILGVMNSSAAREFPRAHRRSNIHLYPNDWKQLPIPDVPPEQQQPIIALVDQILTTKQANPKADISMLEADLNACIAALYGLKPDEIHLIEDSAPSSGRDAEPPPNSPPVA
jgi:adenine-specific DNA-methyltransferase